MSLLFRNPPNFLLGKIFQNARLPRSTPSREISEACFETTDNTLSEEIFCADIGDIIQVESH